jgi:hypothetical protein
MDRCDYRAMTTGDLLGIARHEGLDEELAIAITERLADVEQWAAPYRLQGPTDRSGTFHFNRKD